MPTDLALIRLLQLVSPGLPIGMYSYSQGLERAIEDGWISNAEQVGTWLQGLMQRSVQSVDLPLLARFYAAWRNDDLAALDAWSEQLQALRETAELRTEDRQTGQALARLLVQLDMPQAQPWLRRTDASLACLFALAAVQWRIECQTLLTGYLWGWLENQVLCAVKLVPLGQVAGQQLLLGLASLIPETVEQAMTLDDDAIGGSSFAWALASSRHEMQYSRLFRS